MKRFMKSFVLVLFANLVCFSQSTWYVDVTNGSDIYTGEHIVNLPAMTGPKSTIQAALNVCSDGDYISIAAGTYVECPMVLKIVTFKSRALNTNLEVAVDLTSCSMLFDSHGQVVFERDDASILTHFRFIGTAASGFFLSSGSILLNPENQFTFPFLFSTPDPEANENSLRLPAEYHLQQNYPNPFNPVTTISFTLKEETEVILRIFNALGEKVETIFDGLLQTGNHSFSYDGSKLVSGTYFYKLETDKYSETKKMSLLK